jgi:murein DD-endopeptidase MepM/ murein hydrolase activator NlpD
MAHRQRNNDEFAFDLCKLDRNDMIPINNDMKPEDYPCYGEKVYAIADGLVVQVYEGMSEKTIGISREEEKLESIHGYWPIITGNVVSIQHDGGEYSQVYHLQYHSINLKIGERVKQGQVIGLVGNTGLSGCPHLHFELINGFSLISLLMESQLRLLPKNILWYMRSKDQKPQSLFTWNNLYR